MSDNRRLRPDNESSSMSNLGAVAVYLVTFVVFAGAYESDGPLALVYEGHWFQYLTAATFVVAGIAGANVRVWPIGIRIVALLAGVWLGVDEVGMVHECTEELPFLEAHVSQPDRVLLGLYAVGAVIGLLVIRRKLVWTRLAWIHLTMAVVASTLALGRDVFHLWHEDLGRMGEELCELLTAVAGTMFLVEQARLSIRSIRSGLISVAGATAVAFVLNTGALLVMHDVRPRWCPKAEEKRLKHGRLIEKERAKHRQTKSR